MGVVTAAAAVAVTVGVITGRRTRARTPVDLPWFRAIACCEHYSFIPPRTLLTAHACKYNNNNNNNTGPGVNSRTGATLPRAPADTHGVVFVAAAECGTENPRSVAVGRGVGTTLEKKGTPQKQKPTRGAAPNGVCREGVSLPPSQRRVHVN